MHVTKLVYFVSRNPKHLSLHFYDFSMNCYEFSKFTAKISCNFCHLPPESSFLITNRSLAGLGRGTEESRPDSGEEARRHEGQVGEGLEEVETHLLLALARGEVVGGGVSTSAGRRRRWGGRRARRTWRAEEAGRARRGGGRTSAAG